MAEAAELSAEVGAEDPKKLKKRALDAARQCRARKRKKDKREAARQAAESGHDAGGGVMPAPLTPAEEAAAERRRELSRKRSLRYRERERESKKKLAIPATEGPATEGQASAFEAGPVVLRTGGIFDYFECYDKVRAVRAHHVILSIHADCFLPSSPYPVHDRGRYPGGAVSLQHRRVYVPPVLKVGSVDGC